MAEWDYPAHEAVIPRARSSGADLIMVQLHAGKHAAARALRHTDWQLLRHSPVPVERNWSCWAHPQDHEPW